MFRSHTLSLLALAPLALAGCEAVIPDGGVDCTAMAAASVQLQVTDTDGTVLTNATAWFEHDGAIQDCEGMGGQEWVCGWEREGPMTIFADAPGYAEGSVQVDVPADECHVQTQQVQLALEEVLCPPVVQYGVEVTTVSAAGEPIEARVEWLPLDDTDWTNPMPCEDWGGTYGCAENTGGTVEIWATNWEHGSFYRQIDVPMDDCGPITQQITAIVDRDPDT